MTRISLVSIACGVLAMMIPQYAQAEDAAGRTARAEQFLAKAQQICPVTGKDLTSMGGPFKAAVDGQTVFLCCRGCIGRPLNRQPWATVQSNLRTAHLALAQQVCPVMGKDLLSIGGPVKVEVEGQTVFLCCKGCLNRQVQPQHWEQVQTNLKSAQKLCPVRNVELGDEAVPVVVEKRVVFVCCDAGYCIKQVEAHPEKHLAAVDKLLAQSLAREREK